ncbi:PAS domain S-box protein [Evansella sp. AB-rgal1]|uniref:PAS domain S-box protein n=1 Tax=Evansella sp. AB-rgal1 TaxID=3242696 RepID=UPI00359D01D5
MNNHDEIDQNSLFMQAFHFAPIGMAIVSLEGKVIKANASYLSIFGYTEEELSKMTFAEYSYHEDLSKDTTYMNELLDGKKDAYQFEKRFYHKEGIIVWVLLSVSIARNEHGKPLYFISQLKDITEQKNTEVKLLEMGKQFEIITENSLDIISIHRPNHEYVFVSSACTRLLGYEPFEMLGKTPFSFCHPDDLPSVYEKQKRKLQGDIIEKFSFRLRCKDGGYRWFETTGGVITDEKEELLYTIAFTRDINDRKHTEIQLKESEERYRSLFDYHHDLIYSLDLDGNYISVNQSFVEKSGLPKSEILNKFNFRDIVEPSFLNKVENHFEEAKKGRVQMYEMNAINTNGDILIFDVTNIPIIVDEKVVGVYGVARDITEKKIAERELQVTKNQLESFYDNNIDSIIIYNEEGKLKKVNKAFERIFGWKEQELVGMNFYELPINPKESVNLIKQNTEIIKQGGSVNSIETLRIRRDGSSIHVDISGFPIINDDGSIIAWAVIIRDITEAKLAEEMLRNSEKLSIAGQLAAGIAHEIRNPMTTIKGFIHLMRSGYKREERFYGIITSEIERIESIISELLILSKPQKVTYKRTNIVSLLSEIQLLLETEAILKDVHFIADFDTSNSYVYCEENQIKQVCINFIKNAIEAMPDGGTLVMKLCSENKKGVSISFIDEGCGISSDILERLGEPFYTTKEKGTGLGFMVSKKIIERHGGYVKVESTLHVGTKVEIFLPLAEYSPSRKTIAH